MSKHDLIILKIEREIKNIGRQMKFKLLRNLKFGKILKAQVEFAPCFISFYDFK